MSNSISSHSGSPQNFGDYHLRKANGSKKMSTGQNVAHLKQEGFKGCQFQTSSLKATKSQQDGMKSHTFTKLESASFAALTTAAQRQMRG